MFYIDRAQALPARSMSDSRDPISPGGSVVASAEADELKDYLMCRSPAAGPGASRLTTPLSTAEEAEFR